MPPWLPVFTVTPAVGAAVLSVIFSVIGKVSGAPWLSAGGVAVAVKTALTLYTPGSSLAASDVSEKVMVSPLTAQANHSFFKASTAANAPYSGPTAVPGSAATVVQVPVAGTPPGL